MKRAYTEASSGVKIPGFRQGKVPADLMKQYINEEAVIDRAVQLLISEKYADMIDQAKIKPVDYPSVNVKKLEKSGADSVRHKGGRLSGNKDGHV